MTWHELLHHVRVLGRYQDDRQAERALIAVLAVLGAQLVGDERCDLAAALPTQARTLMTRQIPLTQPLSAPTFVEAVAGRLATTIPTARWDTSTVLTALADLADPGLTDRLITQLPHGYALLFGRAQLATAA
ncbi:DUF2267 domain-containing protein [Kitasatospora sp. McL0602]|uniref:DUF2267 domain-containing protein n=1 Tax=Kitasatospora sp. McL0602 TaxID=3439530 RepID=UPI003F8B09E5